MEGVLPDEVLHRKKSPYPKTWDPGYLELLRRRLQGVLAEQHNPLFDLVDRNGLLALLDGQQPWPWYGQLMRLPQTIAYMLQLEFWLREYRVSLV
jgi:asparagine synthase (glutamine-hydrolysing)